MLIYFNEYTTPISSIFKLVLRPAYSFVAYAWSSRPSTYRHSTSCQVVSAISVNIASACLRQLWLSDTSSHTIRAINIGGLSFSLSQSRTTFEFRNCTTGVSTPICSTIDLYFWSWNHLNVHFMGTLSKASRKLTVIVVFVGSLPLSHFLLIFASYFFELSFEFSEFFSVKSIN